MSKRPSHKTTNVTSPPIIKKKKGVLINERTRKLTKKGRAFLASVRARAAIDPFIEMEKDFREILRKVGLPDDPTEGGNKYPFRSHVTPELKEESEEWYVAWILDFLSERKQALKEGLNFRAETLGNRANDLLTEALHKPDVLKAGNYGAVQSAKAKKLAEKRRAAVFARDQKLRDMAEELRSNHPHLPQRSIARILFNHPTKPGEKLSESRIREIIKPA